MRLLIYTPTYALEDGRLAMARECGESIREQRIDGTITWHVGTHNPFPGYDHRNVLAQYQAAQAMALDLGYDALLTVEHDNRLPDPQAVQRMLETPADVVYAPYMLRHGFNVLNVWRYEEEQPIGDPLSLWPEELAQARAAVTWRVCGAGMGCTLFHREVLENIPFRRGMARQYAPDLPFVEDAWEAGVLSMARMDVPVLHRDGDRWIDPFGPAERWEYRSEVTLRALMRDGEAVDLVAGREIALPGMYAYDLVRVGLVQGVGA